VKKYKNIYLNIALVLFICNGVSILSVTIYILNWEVLSIIWIIVAFSVITLTLSVALMGFKAKYKKYDAHDQYNPIHHKKSEYIISNIGLRINTCFIKLLNVIHNINKSNGIKCTNNATDNHTLHGNRIISRIKRWNNQMQIKPKIFLSGEPDCKNKHYLLL